MPRTTEVRENMDFEQTTLGKVVCPLCRYTWVDSASLRAHLQKPHRTCPECGAQRVGLKQHISHVHSGTRKPRS